MSFFAGSILNYQRLFAYLLIISMLAAQTACGQQDDAQSAAPVFPVVYDQLGISKGSADAPVVLREFGDYQCPACRRFYAAAYAPLVRDYVETGKVRLVFFDLPLQHRHALVAAQAARCAGEQGDYWSMHESLYRNQAEWSSEREALPLFGEYAQTAGLDSAELVRCITDEDTLDAVNRSAAAAAKLGIASTPLLILDSLAIRGAIPYAELKALIDERLAGASAAAGSTE